MPGSNAIELDFADGKYNFRLPLVRIRELEAKCGEPGPPVGIGKIFNRLIKGTAEIKGQLVHAPGAAEFYACDIVETIRQGLIGGGYGTVNGERVTVTPVVATRLIDAYVLEQPLVDHWSTAVSILGACIVGYEPPKKD